MRKKILVALLFFVAMYAFIIYFSVKQAVAGEKEDSVVLTQTGANERHGLVLLAARGGGRGGGGGGSW